MIQLKSGAWVAMKDVSAVTVSSSFGFGGPAMPHATVLVLRGGETVSAGRFAQVFEAEAYRDVLAKQVSDAHST